MDEEQSQTTGRRESHEEQGEAVEEVEKEVENEIEQVEQVEEGTSIGRGSKMMQYCPPPYPCNPISVH